jgi:hypothetical protein
MRHGPSITAVPLASAWTRVGWDGTLRVWHTPEIAADGSPKEMQ